MGRDWKSDLASRFNVEVPRKEQPQKSYGGNYKNNKGNNSNKTKVNIVPVASYNFIKLNDRVLLPPLGKMIAENKEQDIQQTYKDFLLSDTKYSGYFDVKLKNITPLFINDEGVFFNDGEDTCIPGSSLRGCLKNAYKIITSGTMKTGDDGDVTDKTLYYRSFASGCSKFNKLYNDNITQKVDGKDRAITKAGYLVRRKNEYFILPAAWKAVRGDSYTVNRKDAPCAQWEDNCVNVFTGFMNKKKHYYRISAPDFDTRYTVSEKLYKSYLDDKNRKGLNLLADKRALYGAKDSRLAARFRENGYDYAVPCFYVEDKDEVVHFGAGPYYRIPYKQSIGEHIPAYLKADDVDFAAAVFGNKEYWGSRVYFENMYLENNDAEFLTPNIMKPLLGAKPTSFQNYLQPNQKNEAMHWDEDTQIRGYKMYWHRHCEWMYQGMKKINENVTKKIAPLKKDKIFTGKIRFENLDAVELGALAKLFAFGENPDYCYKLGMGKPLGMGSVNITAKLYLRDKNYYTRLFDGESFACGLQGHDKDYFIAEFDKYVQDNLTKSSYKLYQERMEELSLIMSMEHMRSNGWNKKTDYLSVDDGDGKKCVNYRIPLPDIKAVTGTKK